MAVAASIAASAACGSGSRETNRPAGAPPAAASVAVSTRGPGLHRQAPGALTLSVPRTSDLNHVDPRIFAAALGNDPARIFAYIRDEIAYEAYPGLLRGPRGTLLAMAGNSADRAALLAEMLRQAGQTVRFARGTLPDGDARDLVTSMWADRPRVPVETHEVPAALKAVRDTLVAGVTRDYPLVRDTIKRAQAPPARSAGPGIDDLVSEAREHYWVQWSKDNAWIDLDPSFGDAVAGRTYTKADQVLAELPESLFHHVTIRVRVEEHAILLTGQDESRPSSREVLRYSARAADLAGPDLVLVHQPENWTGPTRTLEGGVAAGIQATGRVKPVLLATGEKWITGEPFRPKPPGAGGISILLGGGGTRHPVPVAVSESIEFEFAAPNGRRETAVRDVFDVVGLARRGSGRPLTAGDVRALTEANAPDLTRRIYELFLTTGGIDQSHLANVDASQAPAKEDPVNLRRVLRRTNIAFAAASDALLARLSPPNGPTVRSYPDSPRLQILEVSADGGKARLAIDLRRPYVRVVTLDRSRADDVFLAQVYRGVVEGTLERVLLEAVAGPNATEPRWHLGASTSRLFERAGAEGVPSILLTRETDAWAAGGASDETRARVRADLRAGQWIVIPQPGSRFGADTRYAWWRIDPRSGVTTAVTDDGLHQVNVEYQVIVPGELFLVTVTIAGVELPTFAASAFHLALWAEVVMTTGGIMTRVWP